MLLKSVWLHVSKRGNATNEDAATDALVGRSSYIGVLPYWVTSFGEGASYLHHGKNAKFGEYKKWLLGGRQATVNVPWSGFLLLSTDDRNTASRSMLGLNTRTLRRFLLN
jgi:hypothetical protein